MKFLCDVHIPIRVSKHIVKLGFEREHVNNILDGFRSKDRDIAKHCDKNKLILITKDRDFKNSFLLNRTPAKLIKINLGNVSSDTLTELIEQNIQQIKALHEKLESFIVEMEIDGTLTMTK